MNRIKQTHAHSLRRGTLHLETLIDLLLQIPNLPYAHSLLLTTTTTTTFLFNRLLQALSRHGPFPLCVSLFSSIPSPNLHSFTFLFSASASFRRPLLGQSLHSLLLKSGFPLDPFVSTSILHMYSQCNLLPSALRLFREIPNPDTSTYNSLLSGLAKHGGILTARQLFETMPVRNVISWTTLVSGYAQAGRYEEAVEVFLRMWREGEVEPNEVTVASVLPACAHVGAVGLGERIEGFASGKGMVKGNVFVGNALVEMWGKCGDVGRARRVFEEMGGMRNLCTWNSMIMGLAVHGRSEEAVGLFGEMRAAGFTPDDITFVGVLLACTHAHGGGLVDQGWHYFNSMEKDFFIMPKLEHYGCMVDLLGRAGLLKEAYKLIKGMPMEPDSVIWGALLGACSFHGEVELAEIAMEVLVKLEPWNSGNFVILSNIYASAGKWDSVKRVWKVMKGKQHRKVAGYSIIELDGSMHKFLVEDKSHPRYSDIYLMLSEIMLTMKWEEDATPSELGLQIEINF